MKKIFILADGSSPHTQKWICSLSESGFKIFLFSLNILDTNYYSKCRNLETYSFAMNSNTISSGNGSWKKLKYLKSYFVLRKKFKEFSPDILHAHFASSYGLLGSLLFFRPYLISVWGADVFDFPKKSLLHKLILKLNLSRAHLLLSTSEIMAKETKKLTSKPIKVIPFGIKLEIFYPRKSFKKSNDSLNIGTIKSLEEKYGIKYLIEAFAILRKKLSHIPMKLTIVGRGSQELILKNQAKILGVADDVEFTGWIPNDLVSEYHNKLDIAVFPSILDSESFGVAVIEASACEVPVVVSDRGGLVEVVQDGKTGLVVEAQDSHKLADAIERLVLDESLRETLGKNGRERVQRLFRWEKNLSDMINTYQQL
jgi:glycosyltransferase involved in cell wall biosynthesis